VKVKPSPEAADLLQVTLAPPETSVDTSLRPAEAGGPVDRWATAEHITVLGSLLLVVGPVAHAGGGRDAGAAGWLAVTLLPALVATRPWQRLTGRAWLLAPVVALAALAVLPLTGVGRAGAVAALDYVLAAALVVVIAAYARTYARRATVAALLCAGGVAAFAWALVPWWGGADPSHPMVGTYFWHNQLAVALLLPALLGASLAIAGRRPWRSAGWIGAPLAVAGVVLSTSRATTLCLVAGWVLVVLIAILTSSARRKAVVRAVAVTALAVGVTLVLPGPPLFSTYSSPLSGAATRAATGETVTANTTYRTQFWREAVSATQAHPLVGVGYGRLADEVSTLVPQSWARSPLAHSGPLQAFADGGILLGLPVLIGLGFVVLGLLRRVLPKDDPLVSAAAVAGLALVAHSLIDTDWTYAALTAQFAVVVGLALAVRRPSTSGQPSEPAQPAAASRPQVVPLVGTVLLGLSLVVGAVAAWGQPFHIVSTSASSGEAHS
jgi:O-antigen ligase